MIEKILKITVVISLILLISCSEKEELSKCKENFAGIDCNIELGKYVDVSENNIKIKVDITEVTVEQFEKCVNAGKCSDKNFSTLMSCNYGSKRKKHPMNCVTLEGAKEYCKWLNKRLPTKEEWIIIATAGENYKYSGSNKADEVAWFKDNTSVWNKQTREVALKKSNKYGIYDLSGNVSEWTETKADIHSYFVVCGGHFWSYDTLLTVDCSVKNIVQHYRGLQSTGFRCVE